MRLGFGNTRSTGKRGNKKGALASAFLIDQISIT
jgi:hypothetical protein